MFSHLTVARSNFGSDFLTKLLSSKVFNRCRVAMELKLLRLHDVDPILGLAVDTLPEDLQQRQVDGGCR